MIPTDTTSGHPFTPSWRKEAAKPPIYYLRGGGVIERGLLEADLSGSYGAGRVYPSEMFDAARQGLTELLPDPDRYQLIDLVDRQQHDPSSLTATEMQSLIEIYEVLSRDWAAYRALVSQQARRREIAPLLAFQRFCIGWDNAVDLRGKALTHALGPDRRIPDDLLIRVDPNEMKAAGSHAFEMLYGADEEENFPLPSKSDDAPETSSIVTSKGAGKSTGVNGKKTRAS